ncbi:alpha/beta fold hydrolase [Spongisporangium articulatum]|uniref:Alpha/beta fold hydrolase n=1 Tax=Spongisporangium articulatum TaxID=3362603 RepID=A0ABW8AK65_9ACTN
MRNVRIYGLLAVTLMAAGCSSGSGAGTTPGPSSASAAQPAVVGAVTAHVAGRTVSGHCRGVQKGRPAIILEAGDGSGQSQLQALEEHFAATTLACSYDRAGIGTSSPPATTPRPLDDLVADLDAFAAATPLRGPFVIVGQSLGGNIALRYAELHPDRAAGFVAMNPVPPATAYLPRVHKVEKPTEYQDEVAFYAGDNDEKVDLRPSSELTGTLPGSLPYAVMFDEDCDGDSAFCATVLPSLTTTLKELAALGDGGRFVRAPGAGHELFHEASDLVYRTVDGLA